MFLYVVSEVIECKNTTIISFLQPFHPFVVAPGGLHLHDVVRDGVLQVDETVPQAQHLILTGDIRQLGLEVALAHIQGRHGEFRDGTRHPADFLAARKIKDDQPHDAHQQQGQGEHQRGRACGFMGHDILGDEPDDNEGDEEDDGNDADDPPAQPA